jgi:hypothetical protein
MLALTTTTLLLLGCESTSSVGIPAARESVSSLANEFSDVPVSAATMGAYRATLGTLPEAQGWMYGGDNGNPPPVVSQGVLFENSPVGSQYWRTGLPLDFSGHFAFEARIKIVSSNATKVFTGTREGYYLNLCDGSSCYSVGLADGGVNINSICVPGQPLIPVALNDGLYHEYRLKGFRRLASFTIDGVAVANHVSADPISHCASPPNIVTFGAVSSSSQSVTELKDFVLRSW